MNQILKPNAASILLDDYDLGKVIGREKQKNQLENMVVNPVINRDRPLSVIYIYGGSGTGKTLTVKEQQENLQQEVSPREVSVQYIDCRRHDTYYQFMIEIWTNLSQFLPVEVNGTTYNKVIRKGLEGPEVYNIICTIIRDYNLKLVVAADEIDKLDSDDSQEIVSTFHGMKADEDLDVSLIAISNDMYLNTKYDPDIRRRISFEMDFKQYDSVQLGKILLAHAEEALNEDRYDEKAVKQIAANTAQVSGSATRAKKLLYHTAILSEGKLNPDKIDEAQEKVHKDMARNEVLSRPKHEKIVLYSLCKIDDENEWREPPYKQNAPTTQKIYDMYRNICKEIGTEPKSRSSCVRRLESLERDKLIGREPNVLNKKGQKDYWTSDYDASIVVDLLEQDILPDINPEIIKVKK